MGRREELRVEAEKCDEEVGVYENKLDKQKSELEKLEKKMQQLEDEIKATERQIDTADEKRRAAWAKLGQEARREARGHR